MTISMMDFNNNQNNNNKIIIKDNNRIYNILNNCLIVKLFNKQIEIKEEDTISKIRYSKVTYYNLQHRILF